MFSFAACNMQFSRGPGVATATKLITQQET
jgi:hypothetical protein